MPNWCQNILDVEGPEEDVRNFKQAANGPTQTYNEFGNFSGNSWPVHDDIRLKAIVESMPDPGPTEVFSFHALYPVPDDVRRMPYDSHRARELASLLGREVRGGGHEWENTHWGCKWGAQDAELVSEESAFLQYSFDTPWGPPMEFLEKVSKDWPTLCFTIDYEEPGMGFGGSAEFVEGDVTSSEERSIDWEDESVDE
tara:strand:+ start:1093 stop:1686 length:594 start_codon:yes stop_codon:yes gene_type:complete